MKETQYTSPYELEGRIPLGRAVILGLQHVLAMFAGNLTPILIITGACGIASGDALQIAILQNAMFIAGLITLLQLFTIGPVGARLPIVMGTSSGFIGVARGAIAATGGGAAAYGAIMAACLIGGAFETVLGFFLKPLRKFFPSVVTGTVVMSIGLSLISVGINSFGGGSGAGDFGSWQNLLVGGIVLVVIIALKHYTKGITSVSSILIGIVAGYIVCAIMGAVLPTTYINGEGVEMTCSWVLNWGKVAEAGLFSLPAFMPVPFVFDMKVIVPFVIMFIVTSVETMGDTSAIVEGGLNREVTDKELSGAVVCDGIGSSVASFFGVLPNTSFSQNVGLVAMTKVVNLFAISTGAVFLILCGLFPKLAAVISIMPQSVLGGAAVMMFASIVVSGIQLITREGVTSRTVTIVSVALGLGYGIGANSEILGHMPEFIQLIFGGSGIVPAGVIALVLNIILKKEETQKAA